MLSKLFTAMNTHLGGGCQQLQIRVVVGDDGYRLTPLIVFYGSSSEGAAGRSVPPWTANGMIEGPNKFSKSSLADAVVGDGTVGIFSPFCPSPTTPWPVSGIRQRVDSSLEIRDFFYMFQAAQHEQCVNR
jgi:hypothetical protein